MPSQYRPCLGRHGPRRTMWAYPCSPLQAMEPGTHCGTAKSAWLAQSSCNPNEHHVDKVNMAPARKGPQPGHSCESTSGAAGTQCAHCACAIGLCRCKRPLPGRRAPAGMPISRKLGQWPDPPQAAPWHLDLRKRGVCCYLRTHKRWTWEPCKPVAAPCEGELTPDWPASTLACACRVCTHHPIRDG